MAERNVRIEGGTGGGAPGEVLRLGCVSFSSAQTSGSRIALLLDGWPGEALNGAPHAVSNAMPHAAPNAVPHTSRESVARAVPQLLPRVAPRFSERTRLRARGPSMVGAAERWAASAMPFVVLLERLTPYIKGRALRMARRDRDLQQDLQQEGRIALWRLDPVRIAAARRADGYCRAAIRFAMYRYLRETGRQIPAGRCIPWEVVEVVLDSYRDKAA